MASKKFSLLKSSTDEVIEETTVPKKRDDYPIIDTEVIEFISKELAHDMDLYFMWLWMSLLKMMRFSPQMIIM